jgi:pimeloyl-ACP methyl ester carboxylesterase
MRVKGGYRVIGSRRTALAVFEHGDEAGPEILFIHGFCQCHLAWQAQFTSATLASFRMESFDLLGHGDSDKPIARADYDDDRVWAEDLAAVISAVGLKRPILAAWSLGARVVQDYLGRFGTKSVAGINLVGAALRFTDGSRAGPGPALDRDLAAHHAGVRLAAPPIDCRARLSLYDGVGHVVMAEAPDRFNAELTDFVETTTRGAWR